jgi:hypothetical protein
MRAAGLWPRLELSNSQHSHEVRKPGTTARHLHIWNYPGMWNSGNGLCCEILERCVVRGHGEARFVKNGLTSQLRVVYLHTWPHSGSEVVTAGSKQLAVLWVVAPCSQVQANRVLTGQHGPLKRVWTSARLQHGPATQKTAVCVQFLSLNRT